MKLAFAVAFAALVCVGVSSCSQSTNSVTPLSDSEKLQMLRQQSDDSWTAIHYQYPDADVPSTGPPVLLTGQRWMAAFKDCLHRRGVTGVQVSSESGTIVTEAETEGIAVGLFACDRELPNPIEANFLFSHSEILAMYNYDIGFLQACLAASGFRIAPSPTMKAFESNFYTEGWNPYYGSVDTQKALADRKLLLRCPPYPAWTKISVPTPTR
ncbi:hypothetical protein ACVXZ4_12935 [Lacisediminihabitans sp. FW035]